MGLRLRKYKELLENQAAENYSGPAAKWALRLHCAGEVWYLRLPCLTCLPLLVN